MDVLDQIKRNKIIEPENLFYIKRNNLEDNEDKSPNTPNKIRPNLEINGNHDNNNNLNKYKDVLNINYIQKEKEKEICESNNEFFNTKNNQLNDNREDSPSIKLFRKNSANNRSKEALNYDKLKIDLIPNFQNNHINKKMPKNIKKQSNKVKSDKINDKLISEYKAHINFAKKKNIFLILFAFGILFSMINLFLSIALTLYGNVEILAIYIVLNFLLIFFYAIGMYFFEKYKIFTLKIITDLNSPEKIENSYYKNNIYLLIYFFLFALDYFIAIMAGLSFYKNNIKIDIKSRAYDKNKWRFYFQNKSFDKVLNIYERINVVILISGWSSVIVLIIILGLFIHFFGSYQFWKRINQSLTCLSGQISFLLLNMSAYCFQFRNITLLDEYKLNWVILGNIIVAGIGIIISCIYFYMFYTENLKLINFFYYFGFLLIILSIVFTGGSKAFGLKFDDYKSASCNSLFKFISEDYLIKNRDCSGKYLFSQNTLNNMQCPKDRIMINWEETEKRIKAIDNEDIDPVFGCINQFCCLKIYAKLKNGFNVQEILAFNSLILFIILLVSVRYMRNKIGKFLEEEIIEKFNLLMIIGFTFVVYIICIIIILSRPPTSSQSKLNDIVTEPLLTESSFINKKWISLSEQNIINEEMKQLWNELIDNYFFEYNLEIILNNTNEYIFEYFDYNISSNNILIEKRNDINNIDEIIIDYKVYKSDNGIDIINFKSKNNLINSLNKYFKFNQHYFFQKANDILINLNAIFSIKYDEINNFINNFEAVKSDSSKDNIYFINWNKLIINNELILLNYNINHNKSIINIFKDKSFPLINEELVLNDKSNNITYFNIKGDIFNDTGLCAINIYNKLNDINNTNNLIYKGKTNSKGEFTIGPFYTLVNTTLIFEFNIEIFKIVNDTISKYDENYNNYSTYLKIGGYGFNFDTNNSLLINNISLPIIIKKEYSITGLVYKSKENTPLESVNVKLYKGNKNLDEIGGSLSDISLISTASTNNNGIYNLKTNKNGQYTLIFVKEDYFMEKYNLIIDYSNIEIKKIGMIQLFNSGKIIVKTDWENNPPDLDLICRFKVKDNNFCYTFFGNNKCVDTYYPNDNRKKGINGPETIEVDILGKYNYFFYVRKYFDVSNNTAKMERKINNFQDEDNKISLYYKQNDDSIKNSKVKLSLYANGIRTPSFVLNVPNEEAFNESYIYWGGFCLNGKKGLEGINIINKFYENEPPKNICSI